MIFAKNYARFYGKKIILGTSDAWLMIHLSHQPSDWAWIYLRLTNFIIRWVTWTMGQTNRRPSVWCSKYFFFSKILHNSLRKSFQFIFIFFYKIIKNKIKIFECPKPIRNYEKKNTWNIKCLVDDSFVPLAHWTSVLHSRLTDFWWPTQCWVLQSNFQGSEPHEKSQPSLRLRKGWGRNLKLWT